DCSEFRTGFVMCETNGTHHPVRSARPRKVGTDLTYESKEFERSRRSRPFGLGWRRNARHAGTFLGKRQLNGRPKRHGNGNDGHCWKLGSDSIFIISTQTPPSPTCDAPAQSSRG